MITPSFSLTATERVLPKLALDFTTASLDARVTFTRTTDATHPATYTNSSGNIVAATNNQARFDYDPLTLACKGLLIEESRANLMLYSSDASQADWIKTNLNVTTDTVVSPDGTQNADKIYENTTASVAHQYRQTKLGLTANVAYTFTIYVKAAGRTRILMSNEGGSNGGGYAFFDLSTVSTVSTGTWGNGVLNGYSIVDVGNSWRRCTVTSTLPTDPNKVCYITLVDSGTNISYTGDGVSGVYVWGAQYELGAFATSYIPTTSAALTRNADVATMTGTNFSSWFNASEGALEVNATAISSSQFISAAGLYLDTNNYMAFAFGDLNKPRLLVRRAGVFEVNTTASVAQTSPFNQCFAYKAGSISYASNATLIVNSVNKNMPSGLTDFYIGSNPATLLYANAWITKVNYWPQRLINNEVIAFSK